MSHNQIRLNGIAPGANGDISINADDVSEGASSGYTGYVETHLGTTPISDLSDVTAVADGEYLAYSAASADWQGRTVGISDGSWDWRYPTIGGWAVSGYTYTAGHRWHLGYRLTGTKTELPTASTGPFTGYNYGGGPFANSNFPTALKLKAGHYFVSVQCRPKLSGTYSVELQIQNFTQGTAWGPRVFYDDLLGASPGPTTLLGVGSANLNDLIGVRVVSGRCLLGDELWDKFKSIQVIKIG